MNADDADQEKEASGASVSRVFNPCWRSGFQLVKQQEHSLLPRSPHGLKTRDTPAAFDSFSSSASSAFIRGQLLLRALRAFVVNPPPRLRLRALIRDRRRRDFRLVARRHFAAEDVAA